MTQRKSSGAPKRPFITEELPTASAALARLEREQRSLRLLLEAVARGSDLRDVLTRIAHTACDLMDADHGTIALVDAASGVIRIEAIHEMPPNELGAEFAKGEGLVGEVWRRRRSVILGRYAELEKPKREVYAKHVVMGVPIRWGREVVGVFGMGRSKERPGHGVPSFGPRDIRRPPESPPPRGGGLGGGVPRWS